MSRPFLTVLSYSGGVQSSLLLERVLRNEVEKPFRFLVLNSNPGMEGQRTYSTVRAYRARCKAAGIDFITVPGPDLYADIINSPHTGQRRIDNPPFWTRNADGTSGKLRQKCTAYYKIACMDRALRNYLRDKCGAPSLRPGLVEKWIGFTHDEWHRCSDSDVQYITHRFQLVDDKLTKADCVAYFTERGLPVPAPSRCVACFANGLDYYREMYNDRPDDWEIAVEVDNSVELWNKLGITEQEVFVSRSLIRLRDMPALNFGSDDPTMEQQHCNSGVCFL